MIAHARPLAAEELGFSTPIGGRRTNLSVGQIYLLDNPLLREPLRAEHVKRRLLGHWGTTPGLNLAWAITAFLVLNTLGNLAAKSPIERTRSQRRPRSWLR